MSGRLPGASTLRAAARLSLIAAALAGPVAVAPAAVPPDDVETTTPIKHFMVLMQENHSFDNYFGTYPGADGIPAGACMPIDPERRKRDCIEPFRIGQRPVLDLGHNRRIFLDQYRGGRMDGFVKAIKESTGKVDPIVMGYYDDRDLPYYWNVADEYVLFDRFFTSASAGSLINHMYWISGRPGSTKGERIPAGGFRGIPTIFDRLQEKGISWKFYVQNYNPDITFRSDVTGDRASQVLWAPVLNYPRFVDHPELNRRIVDLDEYYADLSRGTLPSVAYIVPSGASEHPPGSIQAGERFVRRLITALMRSRHWDTSAFMWTYDDWGGWYDHVPPPRVDRYGYGFRAPALLVSPYAKRGHVDSTTLDFTSFLKFIERNWDVAPLAERDRRAGNFTSAFDFDSPPRQPKLLLKDRTSESAQEPRRIVIYTAYSGVLAVGMIVVGTALRRRRRSGADERRFDGSIEP